MTNQTQVSVQSEVYTFRPRDYDVFAGLDVDRHSMAATFRDHDRLMQSVRLTYSAPLICSVRLASHAFACVQRGFMRFANVNDNL
jgi:hypothetical protein